MLLTKSRIALEQCVRFEQDVRAGKINLNKEAISTADDYRELTEEKNDQVVDLVEACEEFAMTSKLAAASAIETSQCQVVQLPPIHTAASAAAATAAAAAIPKSKPKPKSPHGKASIVRVLQPLQVSPTGVAAVLNTNNL